MPEKGLRDGVVLKRACQACRDTRDDQYAGQDVAQIVFQRGHGLSPASSAVLKRLYRWLGGVKIIDFCKMIMQ